MRESHTSLVCGRLQNKNTNSISIELSRNCINCLKKGENLGLIIKNIEYIFTHEDTHRQQIINSDEKVKIVPLTSPTNEKNIKDYVNNECEVDAYARQVGKAIVSSYQNVPIENVFDMIRKGEIENQIWKNIEVFKNTQFGVSLETRKRFFKRLYEYLSNFLKN